LGDFEGPNKLLISATVYVTHSKRNPQSSDSLNQLHPVQGWISCLFAFGLAAYWFRT